MSSFRLLKLFNITLLGIFLQYNSHAQTIAKLRFDDDFSYLKADSLKSTWKEKIKNVKSLLLLFFNEKRNNNNVFLLITLTQ